MDFVDAMEQRIKLYILKGIQLGMIYGSSEHKKTYQMILNRELERLTLDPSSLSPLEKRKNDLLSLIQCYSHTSPLHPLFLPLLKGEFVRTMKEIEKSKSF